MKTSNRLFKAVDNYFGGAAVLASSALSGLLRSLGLLHRRDEPKRILLSKFCCQGDALVSLLAIAEFRRLLPRVEMTVLASRKTEEVYRTCGLFDKVISVNISGSKGLTELAGSGFFSAIRQLWQSGPFDTFIDMDLYYRFSLITGVLMRAGTRIGFRTSWIRSIALTASVSRHRTQSEAECYFDLFGLLGLLLERRYAPFRFAFLESGSKDARKFLMSKGWDGAAPLVGLVPGSSINWPAKRWSTQRFSELIGEVHKIHGMHFLILGQDFEKELARYLREKHPSSTIDLTGRTDFQLLACCLSLCSLFIGNDSGPMHLADMLGIPVVAIFGPTDERKWGPLNGVSTVVASKSVDCRPCYYLSRMPDCNHLKCLATISVEQVVTVVENIVGDNKTARR